MSSQVALAMYEPDGRLSRKFGDKGKLLTAFRSTTGVEGNAVAIDSRNRIVVAGRAAKGRKSQFAIARYTPDGALDKSFHRDGKVLTDFNSTAFEGSRAIVIDRADRVVVGGFAVQLATGPEGDITMRLSTIPR